MSGARNSERALALSGFISQLTAVDQLSDRERARFRSEEREAIKQDLWRSWREADAAWHLAMATEIGSHLSRVAARYDAPRDTGAEKRVRETLRDFIAAADRYASAPVCTKEQCRDKIARFRGWRGVGANIVLWPLMDAARERWSACAKAQAETVGLERVK